MFPFVETLAQWGESVLLSVSAMKEDCVLHSGIRGHPIVPGDIAQQQDIHMAVCEVPHWGWVVPQVSHLMSDQDTPGGVDVLGCVHLVDV